MADYRAISLNVLHSSMEITDQFNSNLNDGEVENRIGPLSKGKKSEDSEDEILIKEFLEWKRMIKGN